MHIASCRKRPGDLPSRDELSTNAAPSTWGERPDGDSVAIASQQIDVKETFPFALYGAENNAAVSRQCVELVLSPRSRHARGQSIGRRSIAYIMWREGRIVRKTPNPGATRPEYRGASAEGTMLIEAVPPTPETMLFQGLR